MSDWENRELEDVGQEAAEVQGQIEQIGQESEILLQKAGSLRAEVWEMTARRDSLGHGGGAGLTERALNEAIEDIDSTLDGKRLDVQTLRSRLSEQSGRVSEVRQEAQKDLAACQRHREGLVGVAAAAMERAVDHCGERLASCDHVDQRLAQAFDAVDRADAMLKRR